jgi:flagellar protein FlbT
MALKIILKPQEKMILGGAVISNGSKTGCQLIIENKVTILRDKDIMRETDADTPCRNLYFIIQLMYIDEENFEIHQKNYWSLVNDIVKAAPSTVGLIDQINEEIVTGRYYQALKTARNLIDFEKEAVSRVQQSVANL